MLNVFDDVFRRDDLCLSSKIVAIYLFAKTGGDFATISYSELALAVGVSRRVAVKAIKELVDAGVLKKESSGNRSKNQYLLAS